MNRKDIIGLLRQYPLGEMGDISCKKFGAGLIHQTFLIEVSRKKYILQGFNLNVFKYPNRIEKNLRLLSEFGKNKHLPFQLPLPIQNLDGNGLIEFQGKFFRLFEFVDGETLQQITEKNQARQAAEAYALFSKWASVFPLAKFEETIPNFHRLDLRFQKLEEVANSINNLSIEDRELLDFYLNQNDLVAKYLQICSEIPRRLTHNDTKINNLIFSSDLSKVSALIDLDTIMPGYLLYDFGDLVRTVASTEEETSLNFENQSVSLSIYENLLLGYWAGAKELMNEKEAKSLLIGGEVMTCLMGVRFLTDHLEGNVYYQVAYPEQNFHRAINQMILLQSLQSNREQMIQIFSEITKISIDS
jgi:Ser/Thr protein kinase RdoA (MazF antagonist)